MSAADEPQDRRRLAVHAYKREWIVDAARAVFARRGIDRASMREIAKDAGYTVGVIYNYFRSKEELYAEVLSGSLTTLTVEVAAAGEQAPDGERAAAGLRALHRFYRMRPGDFDLSFYLYQGARPVGLDHELDGRLNGLVVELFDVLAGALVADGIDLPDQARSHAVRATSAIFGLILMAQTGRLPTLGERPDDVLELMLADTLGRDGGR